MRGENFSRKGEFPSDEDWTQPSGANRSCALIRAFKGPASRKVSLALVARGGVQ